MHVHTITQTLSLHYTQGPKSSARGARQNVKKETCKQGNVN